MILLHNIGLKLNSNYNTREEILASTGPLSFDGVYENVYLNRDILKGRDVLFFVTGDYIGKDNGFDTGQFYEKFCTWPQLHALHTIGRMGWHSWSHRDLTTLTDEELKHEVTAPGQCEDFAYPYGKFDERVIQAVKDAGYKRAWSVTEGDNSAYQLLRHYL